MKNKIKVREAVLTDLTAIHHLNQVALGYDYPFEKAKYQFMEVLEDQSHYLLAVAEDLDHHEVVAYVHVELYQSLYLPPALNVLALAVSQNYQRQGIGQALVEWLVMAGKSRGIHLIRLNSGFERQAAHAFYRKAGFQEVKNQKKFIKNI